MIDKLGMRGAPLASGLVERIGELCAQLTAGVTEDEASLTTRLSDLTNRLNGLDTLGVDTLAQRFDVHAASMEAVLIVTPVLVLSRVTCDAMQERISALQEEAVQVPASKNMCRGRSVDLI